jgi:2-keto-4-pentenoate hydratase/2-oxohepta-3-ene-1,7-dioic acid hydratase in catechol pathway
VIRVSKNGKYIKERDAHNYYDGITLGIDFTARDIQSELKKKGLPWEKAKAWDNSAVVGKYKVIPPNFDAKNINFFMNKNGMLVQQGNSNQMIHSIDKIVSYISNYFSLNIGDMIFTGTPAGVGECVVGDELEGFYEGESLFKLRVQ